MPDADSPLFAAPLFIGAHAPFDGMLQRNLYSMIGMLRGIQVCGATEVPRAMADLLERAT
jgi:hypothetical protein